MKNSGKFQISAFILIIAGFLLYVITDGNFSTSLFQKEVKTVSTDGKFDVLNNITEDLNLIGKNSKIQKEKLQMLLTEVDKLDREVNEQKQLLKKIKSNNLKLTSGSKKSNNQKRTVSSNASPSPIKSWNVFIQNAKNMTGQETQINFVENEGHRFLSIVPEKLFPDAEIYLRPLGIQLGYLISNAANNLNIDNIVLKYLEGDSMAIQRTAVLERFLNRISEGRIKVATQGLTPESFDFKTNEKMEIWIELQPETKGT